MTVQHGRGERGPKSRVTGELVCGDETLVRRRAQEEPRGHVGRTCSRARSIDDYYRERTADLSKVTVPLLSAANWGGQGLHTRGNFEGLLARRVEAEMARSARRLALGAFLHRLRGRAPEALLRSFPERRRQRLGQAAARAAAGAPSARSSSSATRTSGRSRARSGRATTSISKSARSPRRALDDRGERSNTTPWATASRSRAAARRSRWRSPGLRRSSSSCRRPRPTPTSSRCCACSIPTARKSSSRARSTRTRRSARGGCALRTASSIPKLALPYRPYHTHDEIQPLTPGETSSSTSRSGRPASSCPPAFRIALTVRGKDYEYEGEAAVLSNMKNPMKGCGPFVHDDPQDRPAEIFGGKVTLHAGDGQAALRAAAGDPGA